MRKSNVLTKVLAIVGSVLLWSPILAPVFFGISSFIQEGIFRFDYLIPGELFPVILVGGGILIWAACRAKVFRLLTILSLAIGCVLIITSQVLAVSTGLASGAIDASGWQYTLVMGIFIGYDLCVVLAGIGGILLIRKLFSKSIE